ncbi:MBL fold metallo-hydrolase [Archaeoglobus sp.]|uniref:MBL fold metallo-hydrolase n=1 Tax=Archaeoglobus sp. TaxID=1872626 RepID=UPI0024AA5C4B|nr:MBL fold metallo-hydrolase [Archaeoglobus sp.]MDI3497837.1 putative mRNA 3-end processing factor [Archaeoglobus sp.]
MQIEFYRRKYGRGCRPHLSLCIEGQHYHVDTSPADYGMNLITHAHTDHYGQRNMDNSRAVASRESAAILEACTGKVFSGVTFEVGSRIRLSDTKIKTYPTYHMHGSAAFYFQDSDILITGDVKDYSKLPKCKILVTEATYGHPSHIFEEEVEKLLKVASSNKAVFGAYPIGKAQRVAEILSEEGFGFSAEEKIARICSAVGLKPSDGPLITSPRNLPLYGGGYILTAQKFYRWPRITLSDHLDYRGILEMIDYCEPEEVLFYHGKPSKRLLEQLRNEGIVCRTLNDLPVMK